MDILIKLFILKRPLVIVYLYMMKLLAIALKCNAKLWKRKNKIKLYYKLKSKITI